MDDERELFGSHPPVIKEKELGRRCIRQHCTCVYMHWGGTRSYYGYVPAARGHVGSWLAGGYPDPQPLDRTVPLLMQKGVQILPLGSASEPHPLG